MPISDIAEQMLDAYPRTFNVDRGKLVAAIDGTMHCVQACTQCADYCLSEQDVASLVKCIRIDLDCADICAATARVLSRQTSATPISPALNCRRASWPARPART